MSRSELGSLVELLMCADPWPCRSDSERVLKLFADTESQRHGFENWIDAYHQIHMGIKS